jgi:cytochrome P450 enzyme
MQVDMTLPSKPFYSNQLDMWVVSAYHDAKKVLDNPAQFTPISDYGIMFKKLNICEEALCLMNRVIPLSTNRIATADEATHNRLRDSVKKFFTPKYIKTFEITIENIAVDLIKMFKQDEPIDLVESYIKELSLKSILTFLGVPKSDFEFVYQMHKAVSRLFLTQLTIVEQLKAATCYQNLKLYLVNLINNEKIFLSECLIKRLIIDMNIGANQLNLDEIIQLLLDIISAGFDTTLMAMSWAFYNLLVNTALKEEFLHADNDFIKNYSMESLRLNTAQMGLVRLTPVDVVLSDVTIPKGSIVYVLHTFANKDANVFSNPNQFQANRSDLNKQLTFGHGIHYCLGAQLAKTEIEIALRCIKTYLPDLKIAGENSIVIIDVLTMKIVKKLIVTA